MPRRRGGYQPLILTAGPFTGMCDSLDPTAADPAKAQLIQNAYPQNAMSGGAVVGRPGFEILNVNMGSNPQCLQEYDIYADGGASLLMAVVSGSLWQLAPWVGTLPLLSNAQLSAMGITLSSHARVSSVIMSRGTAGKVSVFSDGTNSPFYYSPTGTYSIPNCPALYGPPTVYYGKMFGIKNTQRSTIVWSEENDCTAGYEAGGYNNAWDLSQSSPEALTAVLGTNEGLYVFRRNSITLITGAVDSEFQTTGTRSGISETIGTTSPWSVTYANRTVYFINQHGNPCMVRAGGAVEEIWRDFSETLKLQDRTKNQSALCVDYSSLSLIMFGLAEQGQSNPSMWLVYDYSSGTPTAVAVWRGFTCHSMKLMTSNKLVNGFEPTFGQPHLMHLHPSDGRAYIHALPTEGLWTDNTAPITHIVKAAPMGDDISGEKFFDRVDWELPPSTTMTNSYDYVTPRGTSTAQNLSSSTALHQALGINTHGRYIQPRVTHSTSGEKFGVLRVKVRGIVTTESPGTP